ncbi:MAG: hypothetical protein GC153_00585 [Alphaproteobacteria bacterium]|nr:hypothetical protein [Alphaproteobacteria bacterium]
MGARTLFIGYDGQNAALIDDQIREGATPHLASLAQKMSRVPVRNDPGVGDGAYWTSAATGRDPSWHGDYFILQFDPQTYKNYWFDEALHCRASAFWDELDAEGRRVCVIDWPHAPFNPIKHGLLIDNWLQHDHPMPSRSYPPRYIDELLARYGDDPFGPGLHAFPMKGDAEKAEWAVTTACKRIETKARFCVEQLQNGAWDLFAPVFSEAHDIAHYVFHAHDRGHPNFDAALAEALGDPLRRVGEATDRAIGALIEAAGPDCEVMMMTGLGLTPLVSANQVLDLVAQRLDEGLAAEESPVRKARARYRALAPLALRRALSPVKRFILGEPENPELARRRFFPVLHVDHAGCIRLNVKGRERHGVVAPGEEFENTINQLADDFLEIRDADTGESIVESIVKTHEAYNGPNRDMLPDLFVVWRRDKPLRRITSPKIGVIDVPEREARTGDHVDTGDFWARRERLAAYSASAPMRPKDVAGLLLASAREASPAIPAPV